MGRSSSHCKIKNFHFFMSSRPAPGFHPTYPKDNGGCFRWTKAPGVWSLTSVYLWASSRVERPITSQAQPNRQAQTYTKTELGSCCRCVVRFKPLVPFKLIFFTRMRWWQRDNYWQIHLPVELSLSASLYLLTALSQFHAASLVIQQSYSTLINEHGTCHFVVYLRTLH
jgi:hypothetical protein